MYLAWHCPQTLITNMRKGNEKEPGKKYVHVCTHCLHIDMLM